MPFRHNQRYKIGIGHILFLLLNYYRNERIIRKQNLERNLYDIGFEKEGEKKLMNYINLLWKLYRFKSNSQKTRQQMKLIQERKLRKIIQYAFDNSEYYKRIYTNAGITRDSLQTIEIAKLPTIDKSILLNNFDELVTKKEVKQKDLIQFDQSAREGNYLNKYHVVHSSGSTGKPGYFIYDDEAWNDMLLGIIRAALWNMSMPQIFKLLKDEPRILYIATTDGSYGGVMAVSDGIQGLKANQLSLDIKMPLEQWVEKIKEFKPNILIGYPSAIKILGELVEDKKAELKVTRIISCGEPLGINLRKYLENIFHAEILNFYGASESLAIGVEIDPSEGMILFDDMNYIEKENGVMYLTSLYNYAQPLIRYRLSDQINMEEPDESAFSIAKGLLGRNEDILWFEDSNGKKEFLHPLAIEGICIEGLLDYQFIQTAKDKFLIKAEINQQGDKDSIKSQIVREMIKILSAKHLSYVQFEVEFVEQIMSDKNTGKKRLVLVDSVYKRGEISA